MLSSQANLHRQDRQTETGVSREAPPLKTLSNKNKYYQQQNQRLENKGQHDRFWKISCFSISKICEPWTENTDLKYVQDKWRILKRRREI